MLLTHLPNFHRKWMVKKPRCHKEFFPRQAGHLHCVAPILSREDLDGFEKLAQFIFLTKEFQTSISPSVRFSGSSQIIWVGPIPWVVVGTWKILWFHARSLFVLLKEFHDMPVGGFYFAGLSANSGNQHAWWEETPFWKPKLRDASNHCWANFGHTHANLRLARDWRVPCFIQSHPWKNQTLLK